MKNMQFYIVLLAVLFSCKTDPPKPDEEIIKEDPISGSRIAWNYSSLQKIVPFGERVIGYSGYSRMIELNNGNFMCVYEVDGQIEYIISTNKGETWQEPVLIAPIINGIYRTVPEIIQLSTDRIIISYNLRPPWENTDVSKKFGIAVKISDDNGNNWTDEKILYQASHKPADGCWEPCILELPDGELQLYFANEAPYTTTDEQEISFLRSSDKGNTWGNTETACFSETSRDGMPVPLYLPETNEIVVAIEDNFQYNFKPAIIRTSDNWASGAVGRNENRAYALTHNLRTDAYQGAPYIRRLPSGNVILSYQGTEDRGQNHDLSNSTMYVETGDKSAKNFTNKTEPFEIPFGKSGLWNSLSVADGKVWAVTSTNGYSGNVQEVWTINGYEIADFILPKQTMQIDGEPDNFVKETVAPFFVGHKGQTNLKLYLSFDESHIYLSGEVKDETPNQNDGIIVFFDTKNVSSTLPVSGTYKFTLNFDESSSTQEGFSGEWKTSELKPSSTKVKTTDQGYILETAFAWNDLGGKPISGNRIGFSLSLNEDKTGSYVSYTEDLVHSNQKKPYTWASIFLP